MHLRAVARKANPPLTGAYLSLWRCFGTSKRKLIETGLDSRAIDDIRFGNGALPVIQGNVSVLPRSVSKVLYFITGQCGLPSVNPLMGSLTMVWKFTIATLLHTKSIHLSFAYSQLHLATSLVAFELLWCRLVAPAHSSVVLAHIAAPFDRETPPQRTPEGARDPTRASVPNTI